MYIKNFSAFQQKLTMEDQNKPFTTTRGHAGQIVGRKNSGPKIKNSSLRCSIYICFSLSYHHQLTWVYMFRKSKNEEKEGLTGYWYFPKPDLPEIILAQEYFDSSRASYPEVLSYGSWNVSTFLFWINKIYSIFADNVSVIGQRWNYPSNEKIILCSGKYMLC